LFSVFQAQQRTWTMVVWIITACKYSFLRWVEMRVTKPLAVLTSTRCFCAYDTTHKLSAEGRHTPEGLPQPFLESPARIQMRLLLWVCTHFDLISSRLADVYWTEVCITWFTDSGGREERTPLLFSFLPFFFVPFVIISISSPELPFSTEKLWIGRLHHHVQFYITLAFFSI
jgi:hypothetical protein